MTAVIVVIGYAVVTERVLSRYQPPPTIRPTVATAVHDGIVAVVVVVVAAAVALSAALLYTIHQRLRADQYHNDHVQVYA